MRSVLKMSSVLLRRLDNRVSHSHHNEIMSIMIVYSKRTYFRTRFDDYLNRKYILTVVQQKTHAHVTMHARNGARDSCGVTARWNIMF